MPEYRVLVREYTSYEIYVDAESEQDAEDKATELYENGALYKDLYDYDLSVDAYRV